MSETTAPATETAASRVWRNDAILPVICSMSDDGTLANIIRADHRSFDAAVEYLWAERLYTLDDLKQIQKRLADVQNPVRGLNLLLYQAETSPG
jgi:pyruvate/oxaloacetate carboxyltransferase